MKSLCFHPCSEFASGITRFCVPPTANIHDCGGLMTAQKFVTPTIKSNGEICLFHQCQFQF